MSFDKPRKYTPGEINRHAAYFNFASKIYEIPLTSPRLQAFFDLLALKAADSGLTPTIYSSPLSSAAQKNAKETAELNMQFHRSGNETEYDAAIDEFTTDFTTLNEASLGIMFDPNNPHSKKSATSDLIEQLSVISEEKLKKEKST